MVKKKPNVAQFEKGVLLHHCTRKIKSFPTVYICWGVLRSLGGQKCV